MDSDDKDTHLEVGTDVFLVKLTAHSSNETNDENNPWEVTLFLNNKSVLFKIDTGVDVSVIPESVFKQLQGVTLNPPDHRLIGPSQNQLEVSGHFTAKLTYQNSVVDLRSQVTSEISVRATRNNSTDLIARIHALQEVDRFVKLSDFQTIEYHISLQEGAKPFTLSTPRRIPLPLMPKFKPELQRMEELGTIKRVEQPTLRICVDLTKLNVLPAVDQVVAQLSSAKVSQN